MQVVCPEGEHASGNADGRLGCSYGGVEGVEPPVGGNFSTAIAADIDQVHEACSAT